MTDVTSRAETINRGAGHRWWVLAVLGVAQLMVVLDAPIVNIALPDAQTDLGFAPRTASG